jgi:phosphoketolase
VEPDVVMVGCGDMPTEEALAATAMLRQAFADIKIRFVNAVDLFRMQPDGEHPHEAPQRRLRLQVASAVSLEITPVATCGQA